MTNEKADRRALWLCVGTFFALYLFRNAFEYFRMGTACAMAWLLFLITLVATLIVFRSSARWVYYEQ